MEDPTDTIPDNKNIDIKIECEYGNAALYDEKIVKVEIKEEFVEDVVSERSQIEEYCVYIKNEQVNRTEYVYCPICLVYCKGVDALREHQESNVRCKLKKETHRSTYNVITSNRSKDESSQIHMLSQCDKAATVKLNTDLNCGDIPSDVMPNITVKPDKMTTNTESRLTGKQHTCDICNKSFTKKSRFVQHKLVHTNVKPFSCDVANCKQSFNRKSNLVRHKQIHSDVKDFHCDICNEPFVTKSRLIRHKFFHTGEKPFSCEICNSCFNRKSDLGRHKIIHTGVRPYTCDICDRSFKQKIHLVQHKLIHSGIKSFSCDVCDKSFITKSHLVQHKRTHTETKPIS